MQTFWQTIEHFGQKLQNWHISNGITPEIEAVCRGFSESLLSPEAFHTVSDPRNFSRVTRFRETHATQWSAVNSCMEAEVAEELKAVCNTYQEFRENADKHWFLEVYSDLVNAEAELFKKNNLDLKGMRICMVGPGAIPYTGLAMAAAGAHVTLIDLYGPACDWSRMWLERFFPEGNWEVIQAPGETIDYSTFDLVFVASMLFNRLDVIKAIQTHKPKQVLVRTTFSRRPFSLLQNPVQENELLTLGDAEFIAESNPPLSVASVALLYRYAA